MSRMNAALPLTGDQLATLRRGEELVFSTPDPTTNVVVVLADQYARLKQFAIADNELDPRAVYPLIADVSPEDWDDLSNYPHAEKL